MPSSPATAQVQPGTYYQLISRHSGLAVDVAGGSTSAGAEVVQHSPGQQANQQFEFVPAGNGYYRIVARHSGMALDVYNWNPDNGAEIRQWHDLSGENQQWQIVDRGDGYASFINRFSGKALDLWEWATHSGARLSQYDSHGTWNQQWQLAPVDGGGGTPPPPGGPIGWASMNGGTTGGGNASPITVTSAAALSNAVGSASPAVIHVSGTINCSGMLRTRSNKTILGVGSNATIAGCGFNINGDHNVIIRNIHFRDWNDDAVNVQESATNIWVDHNSFTNGYDGAVDVKRESDFVTVSWNHFYNHDKSMLLGHSDGHTADIGNLRVTYHHNYFDGTHTRHPRVRFGNPVHVFNNYFRDNREYGVASTMGAGVLVEGNYFQNVSNPTHVGYAASGPGSLVFRDNVLVNSGTPETGGSVASIPYSYQLTNPQNVPSTVVNGAGAGRLSF
ncbi:RICIN domain-containing protein [Natronosporangium hydrolyticum]|uniref:RICIN domain-containing protein n=2 Tax=Natronosporangium hydrolyticum TaxID=2811111 RepID=A0A895YSN0_9ACTN|nr:RICIN domain-containing protein [Natronosporangium hydrolyticum]